MVEPIHVAEGKVTSVIQESIAVKTKTSNNHQLITAITQLTEAVITAFEAGNKVLFCGNGGSAADAQHLAAEFSGRFHKDRDPLPSEALHVNTSYLTAVANDYSYNEIYSRIIKGSGKSGDVLIGLSTSGNSENIIAAFKQAKKQKITTAGFTGATGGKMKPLCDYLLAVPSTDTPRVQEAHIMLGHIICQLVEERLYPH